MLKQRIITAFVLLFAFLGALFLVSWEVFAFIIGAALGVGAWEWARLAGLHKTVAQIAFTLFVSVIAILIAVYSEWARNEQVFQTVMAVACGWWVFALVLVKSYPNTVVLWGSSFFRLLMGILVLIPAWLGCVYLRQQSSGAVLVLFVVFIVAAADIGAYFTGKAIGKTKLAPTVSPGKSWEGVGGGSVFAVVIALLFNFLFSANALLPLVLIAVPTALVSVVGDLLESMIKRHRGVKDSSQLLPGHGGVLDRIDGLVAAIPVFTLVFIFSDWHF